MIVHLLLLALGAPMAQPSNVTPAMAIDPVAVTKGSPLDDRVAEYETKRKAAGKDIDKLWDLYLWCDANAMEKQGRSCLRAIVKEDDGHRGAREGLGHLEYDGKWFTTAKKLAKYKQEEEERIAKEEGLVRYEGEWVPAEHLPFLEEGLVQDENGLWVDAETIEKLKSGWVKQDLIWVSPEEKEKVDEGLWKCGEEWKTLEEANGFHSKLETMWVIPTESYTLYTTCDRDLTTKVLEHMERVLRDMKRAFGTLPTLPVNVAILRNQEQYNAFAAGGDHRAPTEAIGFSSIHYGYFADNWFQGDDLEFIAAGVGYWDDSSDAGNSWGIHSVRHAAALSLVERMDPSPKILAEVAKRGLDRWAPKSFWEEKRFPDWYRFGLATYAERYFIDQFVAQGGNYHWAREWSLKSLDAKGGLSPLSEIFEGKLSTERYDESTKLLNEYGLMMSFILDGKCEPVVSAYNKVKDALVKNEDKDLAQALKGLEKALTDNQSALRKYATL